MRRITSALPGCLLVLSICSMLMGVSWAADKDQSDIAKRIDASANVLNEIMATPDKAIPDKVMRDRKMRSCSSFDGEDCNRFRRQSR